MPGILGDECPQNLPASNYKEGGGVPWVSALVLPTREVGLLGVTDTPLPPTSWLGDKSPPCHMISGHGLALPPSIPLGNCAVRFLFHA